MLELSGEGVQWSNLFQNDSNVGLSFGQSLIMMFIDIILYGTLAYYLDNVLPSQYGNRKAPLFFLKSSFWSQKKICRQRQPENYVQYNANVNQVFTSDCEDEHSVQVLPNEEADQIRTILNENPRTILDENPRETSIPDIITDNAFHSSFGIIVKKNKINLNTNFPLEEPDVTEMNKHERVNGDVIKAVPKAVSNGTVERNHYPDDIEPVSADLIGREAIVIENLSKEFSGCRKKTTKALENVHLTIYEGQITAILGE